jgi:hypothetical protein
VTGSGADATVPTVSKPSGPSYDVGVLLVHGMGEQPEGDTLLAFGEPIVRWLRRWFDSSPAGAAIKEVRASLHPARELRAEPAHAELSVRAHDDGGQLVEQRWLMAESWWGGDVQRPPFGKLTFWMLTIGAWVVFSHFGKHRRFGTIGGEAKAILVSLFVSLPIALAFEALVVALSLLAVLPIPQIRRSLSSFLLAMSGVLGDAFVLLENPLQRAAIVERARRSLRWLADDCKVVIVLAHSQGAAIAHDLLSGNAPPQNFKALLTFGSGLQKLNQITTAQGQGYAHPMAIAVPLTAALLALLIPAAFGFRDSASDGLGLSSFGLLVIATVALIAFLPLYLTMRTYWTDDATPQARLLSAPLLRFIESKSWVDVFATCDLVPNGALYREAGAEPVPDVKLSAPPAQADPAPTSVEIVNRRALLDDHTTYWDNSAEFLPLVADMLGRVAGLRIIEPVDRSALETAVDRYRRCVRWLQIHRWAVGAALVAAATLFRGQFAGWGKGTKNALEHVPFGVGSLATGFVGSVDRVAGWAGPRLGTNEHAGEIALGFVLPLLVIVILKMAFGPIWQLWARETVWQVLSDRRATSASASTTSPTAAGEAERPKASLFERKLPRPFLTDAAVIGLAVAPLASILGAWGIGEVSRAWNWLLLGAGALVPLSVLFTTALMAVALKGDVQALWTSRGRLPQGWVKIGVGLTMLSILVSFELHFIPGVSENIVLAPYYGTVGLLLLVLAVVGWAKLIGRFAHAIWKVTAVGIPLVTLFTATLLSSKSSEWSGRVGGPIFGFVVALGLLWLIASIVERRVAGTLGTGG